MSSISRRHNGLMALSVIGAPVLGEVFAPQSQDRTPASATPRDPSLATNYRGSGLVLRRFLVVQACPGKGRLPTRLEPFVAVVARAASGHDGLNAFNRRSRPTSTS